MMMYFQRAHDVRMRILSWLLVIHSGGGGGAKITPPPPPPPPRREDHARRNPQRGALPSLACPAEQDRYDIHSLES